MDNNHRCVQDHTEQGKFVKKIDRLFTQRRVQRFTPLRVTRAYDCTLNCLRTLAMRVTTWSQDAHHI